MDKYGLLCLTNPMNWKTLIKRIQRVGKLTETDIAKAVGSKQQQISSLKLGSTKNPNWELGDKLIKLDKNIRKL